MSASTNHDQSNTGAPPLGEFSKLSVKHWAMLRDESGIDDLVIRERDYHTATNRQTLKHYGFSLSQQHLFPGLILPLKPLGSEQTLYILRPDVPRTNADGDVRKYELPKGATMRLDVPPRCRAALGDPSVALWVTEGQRKADAGASCGLCIVDLLGVWAMKGRNNQGGVVLLADFDYVAWNDRRVYVVFDSDIMQKRSVREAVARFSEHAKRKGADVVPVYLPSGPNGEKVGLDDYLRTHTRADLEALAQQRPPILADPDARPSGKLKGLPPTLDPALVERLQRDGLTKVLADEITAVMPVTRDAGDRLYHYAGGVYQSHGERQVAARAQAWMEAHELAAFWSKHLGNEVVEYVQLKAPELWEQPPAAVLNVRNGLLNVVTHELLPHSPSHLSSIQLPITYDPAATCAAWDTFVTETFPEDARVLAWEILGDALVPDRSMQKAVLLIGEGANGKSVYLAAVKTMLGRRNVATASLHRLERDRFATAGLVGKLANICADLPSDHLESTSTFKAIVGGDALPAEYKFKDTFDFTPFCRLLFSANHYPRSADSSEAFFRRWVVVPFTRTFAEDDPATLPRSVLDARLADPAEQSGALNHALAALDGLRGRQRFSEPASVKQALAEFRATTDPFAIWLDQATLTHPDAKVPKSDLRRAYADYAREKGLAPMSDTAFGLAMKRLRPKITVADRTMGGGRQVHCYIGLGLLTRGPQPSGPTQGTQGTQGYSNLSSADSVANATPGEAGNGSNTEVSQTNINIENPAYPAYPAYPSNGYASAAQLAATVTETRLFEDDEDDDERCDSCGARLVLSESGRCETCSGVR